MLALTLQQPWAYAVRELGKTVENREWAPPPALVGQRFCIHAGRYDRLSPRRVHDQVFADLEGLHDARLLIEPMGRPLEERMMAQSGGIVAVVTLDRVSERNSGDPIEENPYRSDHRYGWVLRDVVPIEPVRCRGLQKLWKVQEPLRSIVRAKYEAAVQARRIRLPDPAPQRDLAL